MVIGFFVITAKNYANVWNKINNKELYDGNISKKIIDMVKRLVIQCLIVSLKERNDLKYEINK